MAPPSKCVPNVAACNFNATIHAQSANILLYFAISNDLFQTCCILNVFIVVVFAILWCALIFKQEGKGSLVAMHPSLLCWLGVWENCTVSQLVAVWPSPRKPGIGISFLCGFPCPSIS